MSRWSEFRGDWDNYPTTWYEIDVFMSEAIMHIRNRDGDIDARVIILDARDNMRNERVRNNISILSKIEVAA